MDVSEEKKLEKERKKRVAADPIYDEDGFELEDEDFSNVLEKQKKQEKS